jgi:hypothetical protein
MHGCAAVTCADVRAHRLAGSNSRMIDIALSFRLTTVAKNARESPEDFLKIP